MRPEHYRISEASDAIPFKVDVVEPTGAETHVFGQIAGAQVRCVFRERIAAVPGDVLPLGVDPRHVHVFDAETGARL